MTTLHMYPLLAAMAGRSPLGSALPALPAASSSLLVFGRATLTRGLPAAHQHTHIAAGARPGSPERRLPVRQHLRTTYTVAGVITPRTPGRQEVAR